MLFSFTTGTVVSISVHFSWTEHEHMPLLLNFALLLFCKL